MVRDAVDALVGVQVFVEGNLEEGCTSLSRDDSRPSQEEHPDAIPALAIGLDDLVLVHHPVLVPAPDSSGVVDAEDINVLDFESVILEL